MSTLVDQAERDRFVEEQGKNISVIAPAGVGKTHAIVDRIVHLAKLESETAAVDRLPRLVVVTYSVRAAQQMQQRAREAIRADKEISFHAQRAFQQTFFGTIHSYCVRLLNRFGHYLGLPSSVELLQSDDELWNRFLIRGMGEGMAGEHPEELFHFYSPEKLYALGKEIAPGGEIETGPMPAVSLRAVLDYRDDKLHAATKKSIAKAQAAAKEWSEGWARGERFRPLPSCPTSAGAADFAQIWMEAFAPLHEWLRETAFAFGRSVANAYEAFRLSEAVMSYDDQIRLAMRLLELPAVQRELKEERLSVLLDEAQDTDPSQFEVLLRVAGLRNKQEQAEDQSFCIVGDFQQAIYAPRSDLTAYQQVHGEISAEPRGTSCRLKVTFRCDRGIIAFVNRIFSGLLNGARGQCNFVKLEPREEAGPGQVARWTCPDEPDHAAGEKVKADVLARHEARFVARRIQELGPKGLGAVGWSQVAVLCPRKKWLLQIAQELRALKVPVQLHSSDEEQGDRTPGAWLTALVWIAAHPEDSFEIAGVLREIFGVSDHDMAVYTAGRGDRLRLDRAVAEREGPVQEALNLMREMCAKAEAMPLHQLVERLLEKSALRERLRSIDELELENVDGELEEMLSLVLRRSAEGATLAELAEELRRGLSQPSPAEEEIADAIQLLTSHKSKGLEWQAVVVPYVFRGIESKPQGYPRVVKREDGTETVCRDKIDFDGQAGDFVRERERQQLQRLLYVMCTRAKRTLVLVDDETLFAEKKRRGGWPAGELLDLVSGANREVWKALPETLTELEAMPVEVDEEVETTAMAEVLDEDRELAVKRAQAIPRRTTPHALAVHRAEEAEPEKKMEQEVEQAVVADNPGIRFGTWWHELMETIPWREPAAWEGRFTEALARSPQKERSRREWDLFRRSTLATWLAEPGRVVQVEFPFLWMETEQRCIEGVMDLAVYTRAEGAWRVIDWKTNRVGSGGSAELVEIYRGQIEAYVRALSGMLSAEVRGSLYLTQTGEWVEVG